MKKIILLFTVLISLAAQGQKNNYGNYRIDSLYAALALQGIDTTNFKIVVQRVSDGKHFKMYWPVFGGGGTTTNALTISSELHSGGATSFNGSAAKTIGIQSASVTNAMLANNSITIAGNSTALGSSVTQDQITGLSSTGIIKRTGANTLAIATAGTDYQSPITLTTTGTSGAATFVGNTLNIPNYASSGMTNPMTTLGDIIVGGASGVPTRLAIGGEGTSLTVSGGSVTWGSGTSWNGGYATSSSTNYNGVTITNTNTTLLIHTGGAASTSIPLVSGGFTKVLQLINEGTGTWTLNRQTTDQIFYHGSNVTSFSLSVGQSATLSLLNGKWVVWMDGYNPGAGTGDMLAANNLSELTNTATARTNLGVAIGTNVQAYDADLDTWATKAAPSGTVVGTSDAQTLTNKDLTSGTNTFPTFNQSTTGTASGSLLNIRYLTSGTSYTPTSGTTKIDMIIVGAGGGGGGASGTASSVGAGAGGGAGAIVRKSMITVSDATSYTYAIGTAGTAGANTGGNGGNGGNSSITISATTYTANGGTGGIGQTAGTALALTLGGPAGAGTNGDVNGAGQNGDNGVRLSGTVGISGGGGSSFYGAGGAALAAAAAGNAATGFGAGGGGALSTANTNRLGGVGTAGLIIIYEYK